MNEEKKKHVILIVDDDPDIRYILLEDLQELYHGHYNIITVDNGKECLKVLKQGIRPDLILLDVMMPEMNGWMTFDAIRDQKEYKNTPIVFLTARNDPVSHGFGMFMAEDYIIKPYELEQLKERLDTILNKKR